MPLKKTNLAMTSLRRHTYLFVMFILLLGQAGLALTPQKGHAADTIPTSSSSGNNSWNHLTPVQKQALAPLEGDWNSLSTDRKQKWLVFADKFRKMTPDERQRVQQKMQEWVMLTPEQRYAARENYIRSTPVQSDQRNQKWQEYQQLTDEQKAQLAKQAKQKKLITNLPTPAESKIKKLQPLKSPVKSGSTTNTPVPAKPQPPKPPLPATPEPTSTLPY